MDVKQRETGRVSFLKNWPRFLCTSIVTFPMYQYLPLRASFVDTVAVPPTFMFRFVNSCSFYLHSATYEFPTVTFIEALLSTFWWH